MIKYYREKGTKEATHLIGIREDMPNWIFFGKSGNTPTDIIHKNELNHFLEANNFEEVPEVKLPEVGKRYKQKGSGNEKPFLLQEVLDNKIYGIDDNGNRVGWEFHQGIEIFFDQFVELPNQEEIKPKFPMSVNEYFQKHHKKPIGDSNIPENNDYGIFDYTSRVEKANREEQTDSVEGAAYELKLEIEDLQISDTLKAQSNYIFEDLLIKKLARFSDKAQNLLDALEETK